ncbi:hypothetical protein A1O1_05259 [Capronia coronata CBS 617.96]|uniref:Uncharacterized protein n=1 Tax=Capronia coronata CBS 617.96 TaxID=1182541 RepID=W9Z1E7_9EURO|nr:uncharacterized protein A1O1_05259 [Capronia coronata CBS 617.96]EXJ88329.1 hypothetical protein A1O1_05259 [Capronia coronata CBS 617.96]
MIFAKVQVGASTPRYGTSMHVERQAGGKLYLVRKKQMHASSTDESRGAIKMYQEYSERRHVVVRSEEQSHKHHHHRVIEQDPQRKDCIRIEITGLHNEQKQHRISISVEMGERCLPEPQPKPKPSPVFEVREPRHVTAKPHVELKKVRLEKFRLEKVRPAEARVHDIPSRPQFQKHCHKERKVHVDINVEERKPHFYRAPESEGVDWDKDLQAWVVNRSPRVRFV